MRTAIFPSCLGRVERYFTHSGLTLFQQVTIKTLHALLGLGRALAATVESRQKFPKEIAKGVTKKQKPKWGVGGGGSRKKDSPCWHQQTALHSHLILETNKNRERNQICQVLNCLIVLFFVVVVEFE